MNISKTRYLQIFLSVTIVLALVRCVCPQIAGHSKDLAVADSLSTATDSLAPDDSVYHGNGVAAMLGESHDVSTADARPMAVESRFLCAGTRPQGDICQPLPSGSSSFP